MTTKHQSRSQPGRFSKLGIVWWGIPAAVVIAVWIHGARFGFGLKELVTKDFLVVLLVCLVIVGWIGGRIFGRMMQEADKKIFDREK